MAESPVHMLVGVMASEKDACVRTSVGMLPSWHRVYLAHHRSPFLPKSLDLFC